MQTPSAPGAAALPLRLPDGVQEALADTVEVAPCPAEVRHLHRQRVLDVLVLAAAALEEQPHFDLVLLPLLEVDRRAAGAEVVAAVGAGERVHRVLAQLAALGRLRDRLLNQPLEDDLIRRRPAWRPRRSAIPVSWQIGPTFSHAISMFVAITPSACAERSPRLRLDRPRHCPPHVRWQIRRGLRDQFQYTLAELVHRRFPHQYCAAGGADAPDVKANVPRSPPFAGPRILAVHANCTQSRCDSMLMVARIWPRTRRRYLSPTWERF